LAVRNLAAGTKKPSVQDKLQAAVDAQLKLSDTSRDSKAQQSQGNQGGDMLAANKQSTINTGTLGITGREVVLSLVVGAFAIVAMYFFRK